jgi:predicted enzyme related to lactoylglutathione lyase
MAEFSFVLLYVDNPPASAKFYSALLDLPIVESAPTFCMLPLSKSVMLGLWLRSNVVPKAVALAGGSEIAFTVLSADAVRDMHMDWQKRGITIAQTATTMDFGETFTALDPDGNRIRVFAPPAGQA